MFILSFVYLCCQLENLFPSYPSKKNTTLQKSKRHFSSSISDPVLQISFSYSVILNLGWSTASQFYGHEDFCSLVLLSKTL